MSEVGISSFGILKQATFSDGQTQQRAQRVFLLTLFHSCKSQKLFKQGLLTGNRGRKAAERFRMHMRKKAECMKQIKRIWDREFMFLVEKEGKLKRQNNRAFLSENLSLFSKYFPFKILQIEGNRRFLDQLFDAIFNQRLAQLVESTYQDISVSSRHTVHFILKEFEGLEQLVPWPGR